MLLGWRLLFGRCDCLLEGREVGAACDYRSHPKVIADEVVHILLLEVIVQRHHRHCPTVSLSL